MNLKRVVLSVLSEFLVGLRELRPAQRLANPRFQCDLNRISTNIHCAFVPFSSKQRFSIFDAFSSYFAELSYGQHGATTISTNSTNRNGETVYIQGRGELLTAE
jgi:hypothetical protein